MKLPSVYPLTRPRSQRITSRMAIVSSIVCLHQAASTDAAHSAVLSNGCASRLAQARPRTRLMAALILAFVVLGAPAAGSAQTQSASPASSSPEGLAAAAGLFLAGGATAF